MKSSYVTAAAALLLGTSAFAPPAGSANALDSAVSAEAAHWSAALQAGDPDLDLSVDPATVDDGTTGVGGPYEPVDAAPVTLAAADTAPRPAAQNYPPCRPGPGDDNCIQLYEPGVRTALASWTQPTGGLGVGQAATAMGGPYEPVGEGNAETAMNGDGALDTAVGETPTDEVAAM